MKGLYAGKLCSQALHRGPRCLNRKTTLFSFEAIWGGGFSIKTEGSQVSSHMERRVFQAEGTANAEVLRQNLDDLFEDAREPVLVEQ